MKKTYKTTPSIRVKFEMFNSMQKFLGELNKPKKFWQKEVRIKEKMIVVERIAELRIQLWELVYSIYPELKGKTCTLNNDKITVD